MDDEYGQQSAYLTTNLNHIRYLTEFKGTAGMLLLTPERACLVLDGRYRLYGEELAAGDLEVELHDGERWTLLSSWLERHGVNRMHVESDRILYGEFKQLRELDHPENRTYGEDWVGELRSRKQPAELEAIREAVARTLKLFPLIEEWAEPGVSERDLSRWIRRELEDRSEGLAFDPLVLSGPRTARPHSPASGRTLTENDVLLVDMGLKVGGYCSDLTRMFFWGDSHPCRELYRLSQQAAGHCFNELKPGIGLKEAASVAHEFLRDQGYGDNLRHGVGHGIGLHVHESPRLAEKATGRLEPGMVVTLEPGIYIDGTGGGRVEHNVLITGDGAEVLDEPTPGFREVVN